MFVKHVYPRPQQSQTLAKKSLSNMESHQLDVQKGEKKPSELSAKRVERLWHYQRTMCGNAHSELIEFTFSLH